MIRARGTARPPEPAELFAPPCDLGGPVRRLRGSPAGLRRRLGMSRPVRENLLCFGPRQGAPALEPLLPVADRSGVG